MKKLLAFVTSFIIFLSISGCTMTPNQVTQSSPPPTISESVVLRTPAPTATPLPTPSPSLKPTSTPGPIIEIYSSTETDTFTPEENIKTPHNDSTKTFIDSFDENQYEDSDSTPQENIPEISTQEIIEEEPQSNLVWIPTKGGKKHHSNPNCSGMKGPVQVTKDQALAQGFDACKKCYG